MTKKKETGGNGNGKRPAVEANKLKENQVFIEMLTENKNELWDRILELQDKGYDVAEILTLGREAWEKGQAKEAA